MVTALSLPVQWLRVLPSVVKTNVPGLERSAAGGDRCAVPANVHTPLNVFCANAVPGNAASPARVTIAAMSFRMWILLYRGLSGFLGRGPGHGWRRYSTNARTTARTVQKGKGEKAGGDGQNRTADLSIMSSSRFP